jgi:5-methylcytosine-specific restriction endonuclease McrA
MADAILPQLKTCTGCKAGKPLHEFHRHKRSKDGVRQRCKTCRAQATAEDRSANPEKYRDQSRRYYEKNRVHVIARTSAYNKAHPEIVRQAQERYASNPENHPKLLDSWKKYRTNNKPKVAAYRKANDLARLEYNKQYRLENRVRVAEYHREWKQKNRDARKMYFHNRRARRLSAGVHTVAEIRHLLEVQAYCCANCETSVKDGDRHLDHWMPLYLGGSNTIENLQWLCRGCNLGKGRTDPIEWLHRIRKASYWPKQN